METKKQKEYEKISRNFKVYKTDNSNEITNLHSDIHNKNMNLT